MNATDTARQALERHAAPEPERNLDAVLARMAPQIERALPRAIGADRFARLVLTELRRTPALYECRPETVLGAMMLVAQLGLEPGPLGHAYLIPFTEQGQKVCQFVLGYKGMIELAGRSGRLRSIVARPVYEGDDFDYHYGITDRLHHKPAPPSERGAEILYYGIARFASPSGSHPHVMYPEEIETAKQRSPMGRRGKGPWLTDPLAMALKTVIRRMQPWLPQSVALARASEADEQALDLTDDGPEAIEP